MKTLTTVENTNSAVTLVLGLMAHFGAGRLELVENSDQSDDALSTARLFYGDSESQSFDLPVERYDFVRARALLCCATVEDGGLSILVDDHTRYVCEVIDPRDAGEKHPSVCRVYIHHFSINQTV